MSENPLFSSQWHRVRDVCPRLAGDVTVSRHVYRGRTAYVLHRRATADCHRLDAVSFELVDRLDGEISVGTLWEKAIIERDLDAPTQDEWIGLLAALHASELIIVDRRVPEERLFDQRKRHQVSERRQRYLNPLYLRFALHDPERWLSSLTPLAEHLFSRNARLIWLILMAWALVTGILHAEQLWKDVTDTATLNSRSAILFFLLYPPIKLLHEFAHALAVKRAGGEVHETGIALMVLLPLPYIDASASALFADKYDRMLVSAAGIIVELACAAVGVVLWANTNGVLQDIGLVMFMTGSISTLLLNGNPLLKFDGYYLLADWIEIPNLASHSRRVVLGRLRGLVSGTTERSTRDEDKRERVWLYSYGFCSAIYRTVLMLSIAWVLSDRWFFLGAMLAVFALIIAIIVPAWRMLSALVKDPVFHTARSAITVGVLPFMLIATTMWLPLPHSNVVPGVVWIPDDAIVRVTGDCIVSNVYVRPGSTVKAGDNLFTCEEPGASDKLEEFIARVDELKVRRAGAVAREPLLVKTLDSQIEAGMAAVDDLDARIESKILKASVDGLFDIVDTSVLLGRSLNRGQVIGYVIPPDERTVRLAIDERWISRFDNELRSVAIRLLDTDGQAGIYNSAVLKRTPKATRMLPSAALSTYGGGLFVADESGDGRLLKEAVFDVELVWPEAAGSAAVGSHVGVRLVYAPTPLSVRIGTSLRQAFTDRIAS